MTLRTFEKKPFLLFNFIALILIISWVYPSFREYWNMLDVQIFKLTNATLVSYWQFWSGFWAVLSVRIADLLPLVFIAMFFYFDKLLLNKDKKLEYFVGFVSLLFLMLIVREVLDFYVELAQLGRASPTLVFDSAIRLSTMYPNISLKDASLESFPGDHAAVLLTWVGYSLLVVRNKYPWVVVFIALIFILPRIMAGAHWASDVLVGGLAIALVTLALGLYTPILNKLNQFLLKIARIFIKV